MDASAALRRDPPTTAIFLDFDGTLASIVPTAEAARPLPAVPALLDALRASYGVVAIVSGRPLSFLRQHLPDAVEAHGQYGLESVVDGEWSVHPSAVEWQAAIDGVAEDALASLPADVDVEHKGLSLTLHFRQQPAQQQPVRAWAAAAAARTGLDVRAAKMSVELHPPVAVDKGTVVEARAQGMTAACYVGDDAGDLPAFAALDRLTDRGLVAVKVAVVTAEASPALVAAADVTVDGPPGAVAFLHTLV